LITGIKFEPLTEQLVVPSGAPIGSVVGQLKASGASEPTIRYSLHQTSDYLFFAIDPKSGVLTTIK